MLKENKVVRVTLPGGIIGLLAANPRQALADAIAEENANGWYVRQVINDSTGNFLVGLLRFIILICTALLYTITNGYFIIFERELGVSNEVTSNSSYSNSSTISFTNKPIICPNCKTELAHGSAFCGECGQKIK